MTHQLKTVFRLLASLKTAIPLLVVTIAVTIVASFLPQPDLLKSWWYLGLLFLNGLSLLFITILHAPLILQRKGRNAMIGVVATHMGILILIGGIIYGSMTGYRERIKAIEGEPTALPGLPLVIQMDRLVVEDYPAEAVQRMGANVPLKKKQESHFSVIGEGRHGRNFVARPGAPAKIDGLTILPSLTDIGWCFELRLTDPTGKETTIPVRPWMPPKIFVGQTPIMAHSLLDPGGSPLAQVFSISKSGLKPLGIITQSQALHLNGYSIVLGRFKRYTGMTVYNRPQTPLLISGSIVMLLGLLWHFYHRHRN